MSIRTMFGLAVASVALALVFVGCRSHRSRNCGTCAPYGSGGVSPAPLYTPGATPAPTTPGTVPLEPGYPSTTPSSPAPYTPSTPPYEGSALR